MGANFANFSIEFPFSGFCCIFAARLPGAAAALKLKRGHNMLIIDSKDCENIDKALKKYKKKFEKAKILIQLRERQSYTKPSVKRRGEVLKAVYKQQVANGTVEK
jgi:small subunit ribosomal protein S21